MTTVTTQSERPQPEHASRAVASVGPLEFWEYLPRGTDKTDKRGSGGLLSVLSVRGAPYSASAGWAAAALPLNHIGGDVHFLLTFPQIIP